MWLTPLGEVLSSQNGFEWISEVARAARKVTRHKNPSRGEQFAIGELRHGKESVLISPCGLVNREKKQLKHRHTVSSNLWQSDPKSVFKMGNSTISLPLRHPFSDPDADVSRQKPTSPDHPTSPPKKNPRTHHPFQS